MTATAVKVNANARSMGMALTSCIVPAAGTPTFDLPDDEMEIGIGIHGEPGRRREKLAPADDIARMLVEPIVSDLALERGERVLAFVNGMGGTPLIELYLAYNSVAKVLDEPGIVIDRSLVGNYITSLEMAGFSVTLLRLDADADRAVGRPGPHRGPALARLTLVPSAATARTSLPRWPLSYTPSPSSRRGDHAMLEALERWLRLSAERIHDQADALTALDRAIGDGDHGLNLDRGFAAITAQLDAGLPDGETRSRPCRGRPADRRPDAHQHGRRGRRAALRHGLHARRRRDRGRRGRPGRPPRSC